MSEQNPLEVIEEANKQSKILEFEQKLDRKYAEVNDINALIELKNERKAQIHFLEGELAKKQRELNYVQADVENAEKNREVYRRNFEKENKDRLDEIVKKDEKLAKAVKEYDEALKIISKTRKDVEQEAGVFHAEREAFNKEKGSFVQFCEKENAKIEAIKASVASESKVVAEDKAKLKKLLAYADIAKKEAETLLAEAKKANADAQKDLALAIETRKNIEAQQRKLKEDRKSLEDEMAILREKYEGKKAEESKKVKK